LFDWDIPEISINGFGGCTVTNSDGFTLLCANGIVILYEKNVIEIRKDAELAIENAILTSAPDEVHKEIYPYL
jgi:hypothetical protein